MVLLSISTSIGSAPPVTPTTADLADPPTTAGGGAPAVGRASSAAGAKLFAVPGGDVSMADGRFVVSGPLSAAAVARADVPACAPSDPAAEEASAAPETLSAGPERPLFVVVAATDGAAVE
ncbi:unnamed protein product [Ectocarpus sp. 6 AP-2014]